jgi:hypothetical protein
VHSTPSSIALSQEAARIGSPGQLAMASGRISRLAQRGQRAGQHRGPDAGTADPATRQHRNAGEARAQAERPQRADTLPIQRKGHERREGHRHGIADRTDPSRRTLRTPGEQRERQRRVDRPDRGQAPPARARQLRARAPDEGQQHQGAERQADLDQREHTEIRSRHAHE